MGLVVRVLQVIKTFLNFLINWTFSFLYRSEDNSFYLAPVENEMLELSGSKLAEKIRKRELKSEDVVRAFINRIKQVNSILNSVVDERFELAITEAQEADRYISTQTADFLKVHKPFIGVPFTTKESTSCEGLNFSLGLKARAGVKGSEDADVVKLLKEAGGILIGVTNIPELNLWCETRNMVYGETKNPYNRSRTVGGSSGGEGSIISASGSPLGIGTDIGGSIRMPAYFCGIFGHKPTTGLTPMKGTTKRTGLEKDTMVTAGPMTRHAEDLLPFLKVLVKDKINLLSLDMPVNAKNIKFYYMEESNDPRTNHIHPELKKILRKSVIHFQELTGKPVKKLKLEGTANSYKLWRYWMTKEPFNFQRELGNCEKNISLVPEVVKKVSGQSEHTLAAVLKLIDNVLPQEDSTWAEAETEKLRHDLLEYLGDNGVLLYPSHTCTAPYHYASYLRPYNFGYWAIFNVLKVPVTQVPCGLDSSGLPMGIQVVAAPYKDHLCLAVARELETTFGGWVPPYNKVRA